MTQSRPSMLRSFATVFGGTTTAQLLGLLVLPVLTRHFVPEAFGAFQVYFAILTFLTVGVGLRIELLLLRVPDEEVRPTVCNLNVLVLIVALIEVMIVTGLSAFHIVPGVGRLPFPAGFLLLPLFANGISQVYMYRVTRDHQFSRIVILRLTQIFFYIVTALSLAFTIHSVEGIIFADAAGRIGSMIAATILLRHDGYPLIEFRRFAHLPAFLKRHRELPLVSLPGAMSNSFGATITPVMMFATFGAAVTGQYSLLDRSINVPLAMIITASSQVFAAQLAHHLREETGLAKRLFMRTALGCLSISIAGALFVRPFLPFFFNLIYGPGWSQSAAFAQVMIFAYAVVFASGVTNQTLVCLCDFRLQACLGLLSPLAYGAAWAFIRSFHVSVYEAVLIHAGVVTCLGLAFLIASQVALTRTQVRPLQSLNGAATDPR